MGNKDNTIFTSIAYSVYNDKNFDAKMNKLPQGWELLERSNTDDTTSYFSYKSCAFINRDTKQLLLAHAGTNPKHGKDLIDDAYIAMHSIPKKMSSVKSFIGKIEQNVNDIKDYEIESVGHSLGAVLSDLCAVELKSKNLNVTKSTTFENPGSKEIIENAIKTNAFSSGVSVNQVKEIDFNVHNIKPNFINNANSQLGAVNLVVTDKQPDTETHDQKTLGQSNFFSYLTSKVGNAVKSATKFLGINDQVQVLSEHKLETFIKHYSDDDKVELKVEGWNDKSTGKTVLAYDEELQKKLLKQKTSSSKKDEYVMFSEENDEDFSIVNSYNVSHQDLRAIHYNNEASSQIIDTQVIGNNSEFNDGWDLV